MCYFKFFLFWPRHYWKWKWEENSRMSAVNGFTRYGGKKCEMSQPPVTTPTGQRQTKLRNIISCWQFDIGIPPLTHQSEILTREIIRYQHLSMVIPTWQARAKLIYWNEVSTMVMCCWNGLSHHYNICCKNELLLETQVIFFDWERTVYLMLEWTVGNTTRTYC